MVTTTTTIAPINVLCLQVASGPGGARRAFHRLEGLIPGLGGRRFYGLYSADGSYRACVARHDGDDPNVLGGLLESTIPGGPYAMAILRDWSKRIPEIAELFGLLAARYTEDRGRPCLEYYRSETELLLYLPLRTNAEDVS